MENECKLCNREFATVKGLSKHIKHTHKISTKEYYDEYFRKPNEGLCAVCGKEVRFDRFGYHSKTCSKTCENLIKFPVTIEFWKIRGLPEEAAKLKVKTMQSEFSKKVKNRKSNTTLQYFMDKGLSETDAILALRDRQSTRSKEKYVLKYGESLGIQKWKETNKKWSEIVEQKYRNGEFSKTPKTNIWKVTSTAELQLAEKLQERLGKPLLFGKNQLKIFDGTKYYYYDLCDIEHKKIIEYNGDYWHANPKKFSKNTIVHDNLTANDLWKKDIIKRRIANNLGYMVLTVWESDYLEGPDVCIEKCLAFLTGEN